MTTQSEKQEPQSSAAQLKSKHSAHTLNPVMMKSMIAVSIPNVIFIVIDIINGSDFSIANLFISDFLLAAQFAFLIYFLNIISNKILIQQSGNQGLSVWGYFWRANTVYIASLCSALFVYTGFSNRHIPTPSVAFSVLMSGLIFLASIFYAWLFFSQDRRAHLLWASRVIS